MKTVRHYHRHGLIDGPDRDRSGYRRYGSADLLRLVLRHCHSRSRCNRGHPQVRAPASI
ncbi:MerR family DNA-binding transcriptional regulator [Nonomuraea sp. NPDC049784]|uniref:MerR family DNA-binding transcriptional regulator n=1 Tax=Nonomuraea sp. NPDC049784 TaxID=3154361 RepID=UPI003406A73D